MVYNVASGANQWLSVTETNGTTPDTLVLAINSAVTDTMAPGTTYSATVTLTDPTDSSTTPITVNLTVVSPLSSSALSSAILTFIKSGPPVSLLLRRPLRLATPM
ncbi:MAG: hypothetical protein WDO73_14480 [Ignavibacteriota bacterium]